MPGALPRPHEARQLCRLRSLRVQQAQAARARAQAEADAAMESVQRRQGEIADARHQLDALGQAIVQRLAPQLPRWAQLVAAQRDRLADGLERAEFALISDEEVLEQARERLERAHADLTRALAREDAVNRLAEEGRQVLHREGERRIERELDEPAQRPGATVSR